VLCEVLADAVLEQLRYALFVLLGTRQTVVVGCTEQHPVTVRR